MIKIHGLNYENSKYEIFLTKHTVNKAEEIGIHNGIFLGATARLENKINKNHITFFYAEQNVLFYIELIEPNKICYVDIKRLNIFESNQMKSLDDPINQVYKPSFLKSYEDGRKVFLNKDLPLKMKKAGIAPHLISFKEVKASEGDHSMFDNGLVIDFQITDNRYYITDITKPDFINFGLAMIRN